MKRQVFALIMTFVVLTLGVLNARSFEEKKMYPTDQAIYDVKSIRSMNVSFGLIPNDTYGVVAVINWRDNSGVTHTDQFKFWFETLAMTIKDGFLIIKDNCYKKYIVGRVNGNRVTPVDGVSYEILQNNLGYKVEFLAKMTFQNYTGICWDPRNDDDVDDDE